MCSDFYLKRQISVNSKQEVTVNKEVNMRRLKEHYDSFIWQNSSISIPVQKENENQAKKSFYVL